MFDETQPVLGPDVVSEALGAFDELEFLGRGTFGETYRAARGDDEYALKVIHYPDMPEYLWEREVAALRRVDHPNVVGFRTFGVLKTGEDSYPYLECEYITGGNVKSRIASNRPPRAADEMRAFLTGLLAGVAEIQDLGILHRDIKPANIALRDGDWGKPVLLDFGLARVLDMSTHTEYPARIGTVPYMSPEQLRGSPARRRSDLFSVGVATYEALSCTHPYWSPGTSLQLLHDRVHDGNIRPLAELAPDVPNDVARVVHRLMAYRQFERLGITEALRDLEGDDDAA